MRTCTTCQVEKDEASFEGIRKQCKACRQKQRKEAARDADKLDRFTAPHVDACVKCGEPWSVTAFKWRTDTKEGAWRPSCNACYNRHKYDMKHRKKEREKDEICFLDRNNKISKLWRDSNPDWFAKRNADVNVRWRELLNYTRYSWKTVMVEDADILKIKMTSSCFYCGFKPTEGHRLNGIDRVDSNDVYTAENTVSSCAVCNVMKSNRTIDGFVAHVRRIRVGEAYGPPISLPICTIHVARRGGKNPKNMELSPGHQEQIRNSQCHYCGLSPSLGIDRKDSNVHYTPSNAVPCCFECNIAKSVMNLNEFLQHIKHIKFHTRYWVLQQNVPKRSITRFAEWCYHSQNDGRHFLTLRPEHKCVAHLDWKKYPATEFHSLFEKYMR